jgi:glycine/D-amino acid oxidase-like deaminating enzyme
VSASDHVLVVGAGIAGASAAYFAARRGAEVTLIDAGLGRASEVPVALINPVRGYAGKIVKDGFEGASFTFALIDQLTAAGASIPNGRGLLRPAPDADTQARWDKELQGDATHRWVAPDASLGLQGDWHSVLSLPDSGWVQTDAFLAALSQQSKATQVAGRVTRIDARSRTVWLDNGSRHEGSAIVWCGGAAGAAFIDDIERVYRPGSVLTLARPLLQRALSYGIYSAPYGARGVVGSTSEPRSDRFDLTDNPKARERLEARIASMWREPARSDGHFRGVRLEGGSASQTIRTLDGFGSRGYLLAPLYAWRWASQQLAATSP